MWVRAVVAVVAVVVGLVVTGCGGTPRTAAQTDAPPVDEVGARGGMLCPDTLPERKAPGYGFGTEEPASALPNLAEPESAWVCGYRPHRAGTTPEKDAHYVWKRQGRVQRVGADQLPRLARLLAALATPDGGRVCTADLGGRSMLVLRRGSDLTGVVLDHYGCGDVRLTDDPFRTPPGDATQLGTVSGVLDAPSGLATLLAQYTSGAR